MKNTNQNDILKNAIKKIWEALSETCNYYSKIDSKIKLEIEYSLFEEKFEAVYNYIKHEYMKKDVIELDRHKIIASFIFVCIENSAVNYTGEKSRYISLVNYMIPVEVGLNWMLAGLNHELEKQKCNRKIQQYSMPTAFACETPYFEAFCRNLYYAKEKENLRLNPIDIAEKLFLIEYITLLENHIDPKILRR